VTRHPGTYEGVCWERVVHIQQVKTMRDGLGMYEENGSSEVGKVTSQDKLRRQPKLFCVGLIGSE